MTRVLDWCKHQIERSRTILGFETQGGGSCKVWDRYLTVRGKRAYYIGNVCGTCGFFFTEVGASRGKSDNVTAAHLVQSMTSGLTCIQPAFLNPISLIMPNGDYVVALLQTTPQLVVPFSDQDYFAHEHADHWGVNAWDLPHYPNVKYYRGVDQALPDQAHLYEFVAPLYPHRWLKVDRVGEFRELLRSGTVPTALAQSVLDVKQASSRRDAHWCLTHYLVDGHHKVMAASLEGRPVTLLAFIAVEQGISSREQIDQILRLI